MAIPVQLPKWGEQIRKTLGIKGRTPSLSLLEDIMPVYEVGESPAVDQRFTRSEHALASFINVPAVAAQFSSAAIINPDTSQKICIVEGFLPVCTVSGFWTLVDAPNLIATFALGLNGGRPRDARNAAVLTTIAQRQTCLTGGQQKAAPPYINGSQHGLWPANQLSPLTVEYILVPGSGFVVEAQTVNTALQAFFYYRERDLQPEDLQG